MKFKCLLLNAVPYGPDKSNTIIRYVPLDDYKSTEKSKGYFVDYCKLFIADNSNLFDKLDINDFLYSVYEIELDSSNKKFAHVKNIKKIK